MKYIIFLISLIGLSLCTTKMEAPGVVADIYKGLKSKIYKCVSESEGISTQLKDLAIKNIENFVPATNEVKINKDNYDAYLTNSYLDTTQKRRDDFNIVLFATLFLLFVVIMLFIFTILDRDKIVDNMDIKLENEIKNVKKAFKKKKK